MVDVLQTLECFWRRPFRFYITLSGQTLTGREATKAAEMDKEAVKQGRGPAAKDRFTIMRSVRGVIVRFRLCDTTFLDAV